MPEFIGFAFLRCGREKKSQPQKPQCAERRTWRQPAAAVSLDPPLQGGGLFGSSVEEISAESGRLTVLDFRVELQCA